MRRRTLLKGGGVAVAGIAGVASLPLFSSPDRHQDPTKRRAKDISASDPVLTISNWPLYIDEDDDGYVSTLTAFKKKFGAKVNYHTDVTDNVVFFQKVVNQLGSGASTGRDMFMLTDWMAARMIQMGWIQPIDPAKVPNLHQNIISSLKAPDWDPERKYSAPWQAGFTGMAYNKKYLDKPPATIKELLTRPDLKGKVAVMTEMRDTMGLVLLGLGYDPANFTDAQWSEGIELLEKAKASGHIRAFSGQEYTDDLTAGNTVACLAWSGDMAASEDPHLKFVVPEEGMMIWSDNMLIPNQAQHQSLAEEWINYYYEPEVAAKLADYNWYVSPVNGIRPFLEDLDPDILADPDLSNLILPDETYLKQTHGFMALKEFQIRNYEGDFSHVSGV
ncbi:spermidine/putrescine ABC transporter substrate-binding protein [Nocardioides sp. Kera G14]|uniref:polyamine ABC transporter substrate-binding protein n=1 Tax=Nocardioides sp. Kera G14 TaxID=2884264 RepID=UPI001D107CEB|nr:spermidine/putrescine ABC transporter substrate-binding protein [Nocardioides sp. Kera G14]UDY22606.1 spermidine/putrescine ABC transporter substrate-binding protein [Nocardioides sp. Kera G14]